MFVCCECRTLSGRGLCDELITPPEKSYRLWCVVVRSRNLKNEEAMARVGPQRHREKPPFFNRFEKFWTELLQERCKMILWNATDCTTSHLQFTCQFTERVIMWFATSSYYFRPLRYENSRQTSSFHASCQAPRCTPTGNSAILNVLICNFLHSPRLWVDGDTSLYTETARNIGETSTLQNKHIPVLVVCFCSN